MRTFMFAAAALCAATTALRAQAPTVPRLELRPFVGALVPTGDQRDLFTNEPLFGLQAAVEVKPTFHVVGSFGWVPAESKYAIADNKADVFQYDMGVEFSLIRPMPGDWQFRPFLGFGAGGRTYTYEAEQLNNKTCLAGYGALGSEFQLGRTAIRLEGRDNLFCYKSPIAGTTSKTRNDIGVMLGLAYHFR
jgi:hypothetical protein